MVTTVQERLLDRVRMDLGDLLQPFDFAFVGDGTRDHFYVEHRPFDPSTLVLKRDGYPVLPADVGVTFDGTIGMVLFEVPPDPGEVWEIEGQKWRYFSDSDLQVFIDTAVGLHSHNRADSSGGTFTIGDVSPVEEYPIALNAVIQALWALATDASFDIDISAPDGVSIPRSERYRQLMEMIGARQTQYDELAKALNIGVSRMETFTVRRTAKLTNRLVPIFLPQEFDDRSTPKRVLPPPNLYGTEPIRTSIGTYDIDVVSGDPWAVTLDFSFDLTDCIIENNIRRSAASHGFSGSVGPPLLSFHQEVLDAAEGRLRLYLDHNETRRLPYNSYWEIQVTKPDQEPRTYMRGLVRATNNEVVR